MCWKYYDNVIHWWSLNYHYDLIHFFSRISRAHKYLKKKTRSKLNSSYTIEEKYPSNNRFYFDRRKNLTDNKFVKKNEMVTGEIANPGMRENWKSRDNPRRRSNTQSLLNTVWAGFHSKHLALRVCPDTRGGYGGAEGESYWSKRAIAKRAPVSSWRLFTRMPRECWERERDETLGGVARG